MQDFASSLLVRMIEHSLRAQGLAVPGLAPDDPASPRIAASHKRRLIDAVLNAHGPAPLLRIGESVGDFAGTPAARLFHSARDPSELIERWLRAERYFHARHRTVVTDSGKDFVAIRHFATDGPQPIAGEDIVVASVMQGLLARIGARGATLRFLAGDKEWKSFGAAARQDTSRWRLQWDGFAPVTRATTAALEPPARTINGQVLSDGLARTLFQEAAEDPAVRQRLRDCAARHGLSTRSLQRRLAASGWTMQGIQAAMRLHVAADLLARTDIPIALVGLLSGYSDQPHFQRAFRKGLGPTPQAYRQLSRLKTSQTGQ